MTPRKKRLVIVLVGLLGFAVVVTLVMNAFNSNMVFFFSPTDRKSVV